VRYRVEELAVESDVSVDTIRYYQARGLLRPPQREGRIAWYGTGHLDRLEQIRRLSAEGFSLAQIEALDSDDDPLLHSLVARRRGDADLDRATLAARAGADEGIVALAVEVGLLHAIEVDDGERFHADAVEMLRAAQQVIEAGIDLEGFAALAVRHAEHTEEVVNEAIVLFRDLMERNDVDRAGAVATLEALVPQVVTLVASHFHQTLLARATDALVEETGRSPR
jgi:DNA-binding transcriptional MerR regulator